MYFQTTQSQLICQKIDAIATEGIEMFAERVDSAYRIFWFSPVPPAELVKEYGTSAYKMFVDHSESTAFLVSKKPDYIPLGIPNGYSIVWGQDGSASIEGEFEEIIE